MKKKIVIAMLLCGSASFNANAGIQDSFASVLSWLGVDMEQRISKPRPPKEW